MVNYGCVINTQRTYKRKNSLTHFWKAQAYECETYYVIK